MNFLALQNAVISGAFDETLRAEVKEWVNHRYQELWSSDEWVFRYATALVGVTSGSMQVAALPVDLGIVLSVQDADGNPLTPMTDPREFYATYVSSTGNLVGRPEAFCAVNNTLLVGPTSNETRADYTLVYERAIVLLAADSDTPVFPAGHHLILVSGAKATGFKMRGIFLWQQHDDEWERGLEAMRRDLLVGARDVGGISWSAAYRPDRW